MSNDAFKVLNIYRMEEIRRKAAKRILPNTIKGALDAGIMALVNGNVENETVRTILMVLFGICGVKNAGGALLNLITILGATYGIHRDSKDTMRIR